MIVSSGYVATYDLSVPTSPYGSVHNTEKGPIGERIARQLIQSFTRGAAWVSEGPKAIAATSKATAGPSSVVWTPGGALATTTFMVCRTFDWQVFVEGVYVRVVLLVNSRVSLVLTNALPPHAGPLL